MCPGGQNCVNYPIILRLEAQVQKLYETISSLMKVKDPESSNLSTAKSPLKSSGSNKSCEKLSDHFELCNSFRSSCKKKPKSKENYHKNLSSDLLSSKLRPFTSQPSKSTLDLSEKIDDFVGELNLRNMEGCGDAISDSLDKNKRIKTLEEPKKAINLLKKVKVLNPTVPKITENKENIPTNKTDSKPNICRLFPSLKLKRPQLSILSKINAESIEANLHGKRIIDAGKLHLERNNNDSASFLRVGRNLSKENLINTSTSKNKSGSQRNFGSDNNNFTSNHVKLIKPIKLFKLEENHKD